MQTITTYIAFVKHQPINAIRVGDKIFETIDRIGLNPLSIENAKKFLLKLKYTVKQFV